MSRTAFTIARGWSGRLVERAAATEDEALQNKVYLEARRVLLEEEGC
jgi:hypothetical protein